MTSGKKTSKKGSTIREKVVKTRSPRQKNYVLDLRIHSPASLGYLGIEGIDTAPAIVRLAKVKGLDVIGVTDFYSGRFIDRVSEAASGSKVTVLPGVSLRCKLGQCDDVVLVCLFQESYASSDIEAFLTELKIPDARLGDSSYTLPTSIDVVIEMVEKRGGIIIPSRLDKTPHQMKVIPRLVEEFGFRTFDLTHVDSKNFFKAQWPELAFNLYSFSSASALAQVGSRNSQVKLPDKTFESIRRVVTRVEQ